MDREDIKMLVKKWWNIYDDESLNFKGGEVTVNDPLGVALSEALAVKYFPAPSAA
jgi:inositol 3-alpha-galactosyltransferase